jgi:Na+-transporting NADH:ubiquinone oxidoreductase subunit NqrB|tara:strand:+ start:8822 stop:9190 length:369 start_codon:yes stop_codon:yes gene_type:complete
MKARLAIMFAVFVFVGGCATTGAINPAVGTWSVVIAAPQGDSPGTLSINEDLTGAMTMTMAPGEETVLNNAAFADGSLTFDVVFNIQGNEIPAKFVGTIVGDEVTGEFQTDFGNAGVTGTRQ